MYYEILQRLFLEYYFAALIVDFMSAQHILSFAADIRKVQQGVPCRNQGKCVAYLFHGNQNRHWGAGQIFWQYFG